MRLKVHRGEDGQTSFIQLKPFAKIHIMGVCGTAMSALAGLLKQKGYDVCGSDRAFYPPASKELERLKIPVLKGYKAEHIHSGLDLVIVGNVISKNMPSATKLLQSGLPYIHLPQALKAFVIGGKNTIMVCGTHGKTSIACLCSWLLQTCGLSPGFTIGGVAENFNAGFCLSDSSWFVLEGDEYDTAFFEKTPKFIHYPATYTLLNNIEFDHADIYKDIGEVEKAFRLLVEKKSPPDSCLIAGVDSPLVEKLIPHFGGKTVLTYGVKKGDWRLTRRTALPQGQGQLLQIQNPDGSKVEIQSPLYGEHNGLNMLSVWVLSRVLNLSVQKTLLAFKKFKGARRRFQILGTFSGITLVEDFAHHPTAVSAVLKSAREMYPHRRILTLFEPGSNTSRRNVFQKEYQKALSLSDRVFCLSVEDSSLKPKERFSAEKLVFTLNKTEKKAFCAGNVQDMTKLVKKSARKGDLILIMSNGDFGGIYLLLQQAFSKV